MNCGCMQKLGAVFAKRSGDVKCLPRAIFYPLGIYRSAAFLASKP